MNCDALLDACFGKIIVRRRRLQPDEEVAARLRSATEDQQKRTGDASGVLRQPHGSQFDLCLCRGNSVKGGLILEVCQGVCA